MYFLSRGYGTVHKNLRTCLCWDGGGEDKYLNLQAVLESCQAARPRCPLKVSIFWEWGGGGTTPSIVQNINIMAVFHKN